MHVLATFRLSGRPARLSTNVALYRRIALAPVLVLALSSCAHMAKARQCRDLARTVNTALDGVAAIKGTDREEPAALRKAAARYAKLSDAVKRARPTHPVALTKTVDELASLFHQTSVALGDLASAKQARQSRKIDQERRRVDYLARDERNQVRRVDSLCSPSR